MAILKIKNGLNNFKKILYDVKQDGKSIVEDGVATIQKSTSNNTEEATKDYVILRNEHRIPLNSKIKNYILYFDLNTFLQKQNEDMENELIANHPKYQDYSGHYYFDIYFDESELNQQVMFDFNIIMIGNLYDGFTTIYPRFKQIYQIHVDPSADWDYMYKDDIIPIHNTLIRICKFKTLTNLQTPILDWVEPDEEFDFERIYIYDNQYAENHIWDYQDVIGSYIDYD